MSSEPAHPSSALPEASEAADEVGVESGFKGLKGLGFRGGVRVDGLGVGALRATIVHFATL